jgi:hypothetical protein
LKANVLYLESQKHGAHCQAGVAKEEAEYVVRHAKPPYPEKRGDGKYLVWGATQEQRLLQVVYSLRSLDEVDFQDLPADIMMLLSSDEDLYHVIHARDLTEHEKRRHRRRRR